MDGSQLSDDEEDNNQMFIFSEPRKKVRIGLDTYCLSFPKGESDQKILSEPKQEKSVTEKGKKELDFLDLDQSSPNLEFNSKTQSKLKNKYQHVLEQAKSIFKKILSWNDSKFKSIQAEEAKTDEAWEQEGSHLKVFYEVLELSENNLQVIQQEIQVLVQSKQNNAKNFSESEIALKEKEVERDTVKAIIEPLKKEILDSLSDKRYSVFAPLYEMKKRISSILDGKDISKFFKEYKDKKSLRFFENDLNEKRLFFWMILCKITLLLIPSQAEQVTLFPISKEKTPMMCWLMESSKMKSENKILFQEASNREHLRRVFENLLSYMLKKLQLRIVGQPKKKEILNSALEILNRFESGNFFYELN